MPVVDQKAGSCYIWVICTLLFICIAAGGTLLAIYMNDPDASSWYPIAGISLVCLPWFFWFLTFLYRVLSRRFGFRMACWGTSIDSLPRNSTSAAASGSTAFPSSGETNIHHDDTGGSARTALEVGTTGRSPTTMDGGRKVHFGSTVVLGDEHDSRSSHDGAGSLSSRACHESAAPLRYSMAS